MTGLKLSTFQYQFKKIIENPPSAPNELMFDGRNVLTQDEEATVVDLIKSRSAQDRPLSRSYIADTVETFVSHIPLEGR